MRKGDAGTLGVDFVLLREVLVGGADVSGDDKCKADKFEAGLLESKEGVSKREGFKREADEGGERLYADM